MYVWALAILEIINLRSVAHAMSLSEHTTRKTPSEQEELELAQTTLLRGHEQQERERNNAELASTKSEKKSWRWVRNDVHKSVTLRLPKLEQVLE